MWIRGVKKRLSLLTSSLRTSQFCDSVKNHQKLIVFLRKNNRIQCMIASVPKLFDVIHFLFQSIRRFVVAKEELRHF